jgi:hypothetical protein
MIAQCVLLGHPIYTLLHTVSFKQNCGYSHEEKQVIQLYSYTRLRIQRLVHCQKTTEMNFNLGLLNLYEIHFIALFSVKYPYPVSNILLHRM